MKQTWPENQKHSVVQSSMKDKENHRMFRFSMLQNVPLNAEEIFKCFGIKANMCLTPQMTVIVFQNQIESNPLLSLNNPPKLFLERVMVSGETH